MVGTWDLHIEEGLSASLVTIPFLAFKPDSYRRRLRTRTPLLTPLHRGGKHLLKIFLLGFPLFFLGKGLKKSTRINRHRLWPRTGFFTYQILKFEGEKLVPVALSTWNPHDLNTGKPWGEILLCEQCITQAHERLTWTSTVGEISMALGVTGVRTVFRESVCSTFIGPVDLQKLKGSASAIPLPLYMAPMTCDPHSLVE